MNPHHDTLLALAHPVVRIEALAVADAHAFHSPGALLLRLDNLRTPTDGPPRVSAEVLAVGSIDELRHHPAHVLSLPDRLVLPALVNAHTHLDLTHMGPRPFDPEGGFVGWVDMVRAERCQEPNDITRSVRAGAALSLQGGVAAVGDIAGAVGGLPRGEPMRALAEAGLIGTSFLEFFATGNRARAGIERVERALAELPERLGGVRLGLQPHAPNTVCLDAYERAGAMARIRGLPICTHAAESAEECEYIARGTGPQRELLERLGVWDVALLSEIGFGRSPVEHLMARDGVPRVLVHVNQCSDKDMNTLAESGARVVYCPRASAYFRQEQHFGPHRYREMIRRGIPVALGTDSVVNLPPESVAREGISTWGEMALLARRDGVIGSELLAMATTVAAEAIGWPSSAFAFGAGARIAGVISVAVGARPGPGVLDSALRGPEVPRFLLMGNLSG